VTFAAPWVLLALVLLPVLWWLLRATPPAPREQRFPAIRLLAGLRPREETPARTPWWLLALRMAAAALIIVGLAQPILGGGGLAGHGAGPALLVIDDGWASAPDFAARLEAAQAVLDRADREARRVVLLTTADAPDGVKPHALAAQPAALLRPVVAALQPKPWPVDRQAAARAVGQTGHGPVFLISDGLRSPHDAALDATLAARGKVTELASSLPVRLLGARSSPDRLEAVLRASPEPVARTEAVLAETGDGRVLGRTALEVPAGVASASAVIALPVELRNQLSALRLAGVPGAGSVALLDEAARRRPVGLVSTGGAETPLLGALFYIDRALAPTTELRRGDLASLLSRKISMIVAADATLQESDMARLQAWVRAGGLLIRFAGPELAGGGNPALLPVPLLAGDRQLGGAMSWSKPAHLAAFPEGSPFSGLAVPQEVTVSRQVLADPSGAAVPGTSAAATWASLTDGTPLVSAARMGAGEVVLFHVTANADWSNLPLSGLFVDMLGRLVQRSAGVPVADDGRMLAPAQVLDGQGVLGPAGAAATGLAASALSRTAASPAHPPGFYGQERDRHALNLAPGVPALAAWVPIPGSTRLALDAAPRVRPAGPWLIALALALLAADMLLTLGLRGLLRRPLLHAAIVAAMLLAAPACRAESPALATHLAYVVTGDTDVDAVSKAGLAGLSDYVNGRTAAVLSDPMAVTPGQDDLSFYPLLYFPVTAGATTSPAAVAALNTYMRHGGIVVIDLRGGGSGGAGSGAGQAPDTQAALRRIAQGLDIPALAPLTTAHVLSRAFYLLSDYPGRYDGDTVWVQQAQDRSNDSVSPVIIGSNDWAAAWAQDDDGRPMFAVIPGGERQRTLAFRFGVNLVMYALTGNYKGDQVHVPAILERLGQ
jgi:hypothetical protein